MNVEVLKHILPQVWSRDSSLDASNWSEDNPSWGQCLVTSLFIWEMLCHEYRNVQLVSCKVRLPSGRAVSHIAVKEVDTHYIHDLTSQQFPEDSEFSAFNVVDFDGLGTLETHQFILYQDFKSRVMQILIHSGIA